MSVWKTVLRNRPGEAFLMFSSDYNVLRSTAIGLNNFIQYSRCQAVPLFRLTPFLIKAFTTSIPKHIVCPCIKVFRLRFMAHIHQDESNTFTKLFLLKWLFYDCKCYGTVKERRLLRNPHCLSTGSDSLYLQFKLTIWTRRYLTQTHQMPHLASRKAFSKTITSHRKTAVLLKLNNVVFAEFFTSIAKILCW